MKGKNEEFIEKPWERQDYAIGLLSFFSWIPSHLSLAGTYVYNSFGTKEIPSSK